MDPRRLRHIQANLPVGLRSRRQQKDGSRLAKAAPKGTATADTTFEATFHATAHEAANRTNEEAARVEALLNSLNGRASKRSPLPSTNSTTYAALTGLFVGLTLLMWTLALAFHAWELFAIGLMIGGALLPLTRLLVRHQERNAVLRQLTGYDDVRAVGPLTRALISPDRQLRQAVRIALTRLLPRLHADQGALLCASQRALLYRWLTPRHAQRTPDFVCAVLKALEQVGDARALPGVHQLAYARMHTSAQQRVQQAARECLPFLNTRIEQAQVSHALLRPIRVTQDVSEALLRAVPLTNSEVGQNSQTLRHGEPYSDQR